jgi:type IV secretory pathway VirB2 component (pilin)
MNVRKQLTLPLLLSLLAVNVVAVGCDDPAARAAAANISVMLTTIGNACGVVMIIYMGLKWMLADDPQGRENARRGIIYIIIGLIILRVASALVYYLMC